MRTHALLVLCLGLTACPSQTTAPIIDPSAEDPSDAIEQSTPDDSKEPEVFNNEGPGCPDEETPE